MRKPEQQLWDTMRNNQHRPKGVALDRIENGVGVGIPDVLLRKMDWQTWIELKVFALPAKMTSKALKKGSMRQEQINWHLQHAAFGLFSYILIRNDRNDLYLMPGHLADKLEDMDMFELHAKSIAWTWVQIWKEIAP